MNLPTRLILVVGLICTPALIQAQTELPGSPLDTTVYLVRHAEKGTGDDPGLTGQGYSRAQELAECLARHGVESVFATDSRRARQTAMPTASRLGLDIETYSPDDHANLIERLRENGLNALVVGHSNSVPELVSALTGNEAGAIADDEYDQLHVIALPGGEHEMFRMPECPR